SQETCHGKKRPRAGCPGGMHDAARPPCTLSRLRPNNRGMVMSLPQKVPVATLGVPRIGRRREMKFALESYWSGKSSAAELLEPAKRLRAANWEEQRARGITKIPSNDFSLYDHVLDTIVLVSAVPARYG